MYNRAYVHAELARRDIHMFQTMSTSLYICFFDVYVHECMVEKHTEHLRKHLRTCLLVYACVWLNHCTCVCMCVCVWTFCNVYASWKVCMKRYACSHAKARRLCRMHSCMYTYVCIHALCQYCQNHLDSICKSIAFTARIHTHTHKMLSLTDTHTKCSHIHTHTRQMLSGTLMALMRVISCLHIYTHARIHLHTRRASSYQISFKIPMTCP